MPIPLALALLVGRQEEYPACKKSLHQKSPKGLFWKTYGWTRPNLDYNLDKYASKTKAKSKGPPAFVVLCSRAQQSSNNVQMSNKHYSSLQWLNCKNKWGTLPLTFPPLSFLSLPFPALPCPATKLHPEN